MNITAIILAAGAGKRMKSSCPKVLHKIANASFLEIILNTLTKLKVKDIRIVVSDELENHADVQKLKTKFHFSCHKQKKRLGTADALKCAINGEESNSIVVLNGDAPLIKGATIKSLYESNINNSVDVTCVGFKTKNPKGYGRMITFGTDLIEILEQKDLNPDQESINICNAGIYMINPAYIQNLLNKVSSDNKANEFYLTDIIKIAHAEGLKVSFVQAREREVIGINNQKQKASAELIMQNRLRKRALLKGVTMISPETVFLSYDTEIGSDVFLHPFVVIGPNVKIGAGTEIFSFSNIDGAAIGENCKVGPHVRIRPYTTIENGCKVGNFVEVKASKLGSGTKVSHLAYIGDADMGEKVNIGAGAIFCNYDGYVKHSVSIGSETFIGANVSLVAPISIGSRAIIGAGSVITEDVGDNSLAISRARQTNYHQKAEVIRKKKAG
ncbi:MAG: UDP-N-acetylglucosamine diphosphorylase/glucosamine-phosphate N-acetyltransferase [Candidatus Midichloriaceae bacterium]|jgi:bifunctional UDP-N-acetylglucosamine pyrophosphorylase/glucosamine-1-phosphate N-acetyltransferase|nr:UDP-N-acetylglucosamine diphosphorylase/glucosamine-phosphate N-acetyltransferase [Candidatus Midichloriaceae bacterium]